jgi:quercetin dioxygenase-like cupin family protein
MEGNMKITKLVAAILFLGTSATAFSQAAVESLFQTNVANVTDQEIVVLEVTYPAGSKSSSHRHNAHTIVYVLEGSVIMQVEGGEAKTLGPGEVFYESPDDVHSVSMNASDTEAAKILVFFLKKVDAPTTVPAK